MSRPGRPPRSQQRHLTDEDQALWGSVAQTIQPVRIKDRVRKSSETDTEAPQRSLELPPAPARSGHAPTLPAVPDAPAARKNRKASPPLADFDRRQAKRIAGGRIEIEARIDLHGMRASEAHGALRGFILRCYAQGKRSVLVITGKGGAGDVRDQPFQLDGQRERGVLKRHVPLWLTEPEMRAVVVSFTTAHARHGGEGALYVQLRNRLRAG